MGSRASGKNPRAKGSNARARGRNPRANGTNPRANGMNPLAMRQGVAVDEAKAFLPHADMAFSLTFGDGKERPPPTT